MAIATRAVVPPVRVSSLIPALPLLGGALFALSAYRFGIFSLPAILFAVAAFAITLSRLEIGIALGLVLIPLGNLGYLATAEVQPPPWLPFSLWAVFLVVLCLSRADQSTLRAPMGLALGLFLLTLCVSAAISGEVGVAASVLRSVAVGLMFFFAITSTVRTRQQLVWILAGVGAATAIAGLAAFREFSSGAFASTTFITTAGSIVNRAAAGFGHPNSLGGFMVMTIPLLAAAVIAERRLRWFFLPALLLGLLGLYLSFSRASVVGVVMGAAFFLNKRRLMVAIPVLLIGAVAVGAPTLLAERFQTPNGAGSELATREDFWRVAENVWAKHPLIGSGPGTFPAQYAEARIPGKQFLPNSVFQPPPHAHNVFLNELSETGLLGFASLLVVLVLAFRSAYRLWRLEDPWMRALGSGFLAALVGWLVHNMFDVTLVESTGTFFFAALGILSAAVRLADTENAGEEVA